MKYGGLILANIIAAITCAAVMWGSGKLIFGVIAIINAICIVMLANLQEQHDD